MPAGQELTRLAASRATLCLYLSTDRVGAICEELVPVYGDECPAALVCHASRSDEQVVRGTLSDLARRVEQAGIHKTAIILVGNALGASSRTSRLYDATFSHGYRKAEEP
jgi:precorrin-4/cobalt-precorrin-4 C11-methyltransferase